jgi:hypothetical protein
MVRFGTRSPKTPGRAAGTQSSRPPGGPAFGANSSHGFGLGTWPSFDQRHADQERQIFVQIRRVSSEIAIHDVDSLAGRHLGRRTNLAVQRLQVPCRPNNPNANAFISGSINRRVVSLRSPAMACRNLGVPGEFNPRLGWLGEGKANPPVMELHHEVIRYVIEYI